ncbi:MAG TPA: hypothetical protein DCX82_15795 [Lachnospiraceae bacterium]|nr:hypothetical protein [Lachnospiraceae bacterium]
MSTIEKKIKKFYRKPIPNDITFTEMISIAKHFGCEVKEGTNHAHVVHRPSGTIIPIPRHGNTVGEAYIKQLKKLFDSIKEES